MSAVSNIAGSIGVSLMEFARRQIFHVTCDQDLVRISYNKRDQNSRAIHAILPTERWRFTIIRHLKQRPLSRVVADCLSAASGLVLKVKHCHPSNHTTAPFASRPSRKAKRQIYKPALLMTISRMLPCAYDGRDLVTRE